MALEENETRRVLEHFMQVSNLQLSLKEYLLEGGSVEGLFCLYEITGVKGDRSSAIFLQEFDEDRENSPLFLKIMTVLAFRIPMNPVGDRVISTLNNIYEGKFWPDYPESPERFNLIYQTSVPLAAAMEDPDLFDDELRYHAEKIHVVSLLFKNLESYGVFDLNGQNTDYAFVASRIIDFIDHYSRSPRVLGGIQ